MWWDFKYDKENIYAIINVIFPHKKKNYFNFLQFKQYTSQKQSLNTYKK